MGTAYSEIIKTLGKIPEKVPVETKFHEAADCDSYTRHTVTYSVKSFDTDETERIKAYLLVPKNISGKKPAIVAAHQHAGEYHWGKCEPAGIYGTDMYFYGHELALRGNVVICPDHLGFEERKPSEEELQKRRIDGRVNERELFCKAVSMGTTLQAKYVSDLSAAIDLLCGLDYVDANRIGVIGHSLGGQESFWLTFYDSRIKAGVSSCGFSTLKAVFDNHIAHNFAMFTYGMLNAGDTIAMIKEIANDKKAFMMINGLGDRIFPMEGVYALHEAAKKAYAENKINSRFSAIVFEGGHSFSDEIKKKAYDFLEENLQ